MKRPSSESGISLSRRLIIGVLPAAVMFVVLMAFFTSARLEDARRDMEESSLLFADSLAPTLEYSIISGNRNALERVLRQSLKYTKAEWLRVTDVAGQEVGFVRNGTAAPDDQSEPALIYTAEILKEPVEISGDTDWLAGHWNISNGALRVGTLEVAISNSVLEQKQQEILWSSLSVGIAMLLFTMLVLNHFLSSVFRSVNQLSDRVQQLIRGDYQEQEINAKSGSREVTRIQQHLNALARHLESASVARNQTLALSEIAKDKAEQANRAKSEFLAGMSQELRAPLIGVLGKLDQIGQQPLTSEQRSDLETATQSAQDLLTVISDVLEFAQIDSGTFELVHQEFDLRSLITNCAASYRLTAEQQGLVLELHFQGNWPDSAMVVGDSARLRQVLAALLGNSLKHTRDGYISIRASWTAEAEHKALLSCTVSDSASDSGERLLSLAPQFGMSLPGMTGTTASTNGLELAMVQRLVELMGGRVQIDTDLGQGAYFRFDLPFQLPDHP
ncbi:MAG TPA: ATP-binding protein [Marinobacter sp.]|nr:ATP-binding protein [Marinobacter sp.]